MSIRIASMILSLLAHGTVFLYLSSFVLLDRPELASSGKGMKIAIAREEKKPQATTMPAALPMPETVSKPEVIQQISKPAPDRVTNPVESDQLAAAVEPLVKKHATTSAGRPLKIAKRAAAPKVNNPPPPKVINQPLNKEEIHKPDPVSESSPEVLAAASVSDILRQDQMSVVESADHADRLRNIELAYTRALVKAIERNKQYPLRARRKGDEGEVQVLFTIDRDGTISQVHIGVSSLSSTLDRAASKAVEGLGRFDPIPPQLKRDRWEFTVPVRFAMN